MPPPEHKPLRSNRLRSAGYDVAGRVLEICFSNGDLRCYQNVPEGVWKSLLAAPNPGTFHEDRIEEEYACKPGVSTAGGDARQKLEDLFGTPKDKPDPGV